MDLKASFTYYESQFPAKHNSILKTSLALRRGRIDSMEDLRSIYENQPRRIEDLRGIGPQRFQLIGEILDYFKENELPPTEM